MSLPRGCGNDNYGPTFVIGHFGGEETAPAKPRMRKPSAKCTHHGLYPSEEEIALLVLGVSIGPHLSPRLSVRDFHRSILFSAVASGHQ
jgi:hypothetical protein